MSNNILGNLNNASNIVNQLVNLDSNSLGSISAGATSTIISAIGNANDHARYLLVNNYPRFVNPKDLHISGLTKLGGALSILQVAINLHNNGYNFSEMSMSDVLAVGAVLAIPFLHWH